MDLLGGYASSDSDEENEVKQTPTLSKPKVVATMPPSKAALSSQSTKMTTPATKGAKKKGSKILSLASVLPQHILDQLTKTATSYDEDSDYDDEYSSSKSKAKGATPNAPSHPKRAQQGRDPELSSFLQELQATKSNSVAAKTVGNSEQGEEQTDSVVTKKPNTILGAAFMTSTVETTVVKKKGSQVVRDIHGEARTATKKSERVARSNVSDSAPAKKSANSPKKPKMVVETVSDDTDDDDDSSDSDGEEAAQVPQATATAGRTPGTIPSSRPRVRAAPTLAPPVVRAAPSTSYTGATPSYRQAAPPVSTYNNHHSASQQQPPLHRQQQQPIFQSKKAQRKHMEKMLRAGNMSGVTAGDNVIHMQGQGPTDYVPEAQTYQETPSHGVRVVPVSMYGRAGSSDTSAEISGKQRSKHQLNSLLASAASLEQQRARVPQGSSSATSHKANAKRKYGW